MVTHKGGLLQLLVTARCTTKCQRQYSDPKATKRRQGYCGTQHSLQRLSEWSLRTAVPAKRDSDST